MMIKKIMGWKIITIGVFALLLAYLFMYLKNPVTSTLQTPYSETNHTININGQTIHYKATVGIMPIHATGATQPLQATMSYIAYTQASKQNRPITFIWCGGPGQSALSENFYLSGPKIFNPKTKALEDNPLSWIRYTDLVYIDMVGSGYGRPASSEVAKEIYSPVGDAATFTYFIENYLNQSNRMNSKIYLLGESYGGLRAQLVATNLLKDTIAISGMILFSPELNDDYNFPATFGNNLPYILSLPTFIRAALYHHKLNPILQNNPEKTISEGTTWAFNHYQTLLLQGDNLNQAEKNELETYLHNYTSLDSEFIRNHHYRISSSDFYKHLLSRENQKVDYIDTRSGDYKLKSDYDLFVLSIESLMKSQLSLYPIAMSYIKNELKFTATTRYINYFYPTQWNYDPKYRQVLSILHDNMIVNEPMKLFVGLGYYDADIPYMVNVTAIQQLLLPEPLRNNIVVRLYEGGHMFYLNNAHIREQLNHEVEKFYS